MNLIYSPENCSRRAVHVKGDRVRAAGAGNRASQRDRIAIARERHGGNRVPCVALRIRTPIAVVWTALIKREAVESIAGSHVIGVGDRAGGRRRPGCISLNK